LRRAIVERARVRRYGPDEVLQAEGERAAGLFGVLEGNVGVTRSTSDGERSLLHVGGAGFWVGEIPLLLHCEAVVTLSARTEVLALQLSRSAFERMVEERPDWYPHFARLGLERYAVFARQVSELLGLDKESLLRTRLADLLDLRMLDDPKASYDIRIPQEELAAFMGVSRQTLNDLLKKLERSGVIELAYRRITVLDVKRLRGQQPRTELFRAVPEP